MKSRVLVRKKIIEVNNQSDLKPLEKLLDGIRDALANTEGAIYRRSQRAEAEFIKQQKLTEDLTIYLLQQIEERLEGDPTIKLFTLGLDRKFLKVLKRTLDNDDFKGYDMNIDYVNPKAKKLIKDLLIPLSISRKEGISNEKTFNEISM